MNVSKLFSLEAQGVRFQEGPEGNTRQVLIESVPMENLPSLFYIVLETYTAVVGTSISMTAAVRGHYRLLDLLCEFIDPNPDPLCSNVSKWFRARGYEHLLAPSATRHSCSRRNSSVVWVAVSSADYAEEESSMLFGWEEDIFCGYRYVLLMVCKKEGEDVGRVLVVWRI